MENFDLSADTLWFEIAIVCAITAFGNILLGHFEIYTSKLKRISKLIFFIALIVALSYYFGRIWAFGFLGLMVLGIMYIHLIWLPEKGINGWTGEPKEKYYKLRGWEKYLDNTNK
jgi:hypothetical protein